MTITVALVVKLERSTNVQVVLRIREFQKQVRSTQKNLEETIGECKERSVKICFWKLQYLHMQSEKHMRDQSSATFKDPHAKGSVALENSTISVTAFPSRMAAALFKCACVGMAIFSETKQ